METDTVNKRDAVRARGEPHRRPRELLWYGGIVGALFLGVVLTLIMNSGAGDSKPNPTDLFNDTASRDTASDLSFGGVVAVDPDYLDKLLKARIFILDWKTDFSRHSVPYSEIISAGPLRDGIPPIDDPKFITFKDANR